MPILFTLFFGMLFGGSEEEQTNSLPILGILSKDSPSIVVEALYNTLQSSGVLQPTFCSHLEEGKKPAL